MKKAILKTLHYADIFDYPLTFEEVYRFLIEKEASSSELRRTLGDLVEAGTVGSKGLYYFLPGREAMVNLRIARQRWSGLKFKRAREVTKILKLIPWIRLVGVTGTLAVENSQKGDDIDLILITAPKRLWISRGLVASFLRLAGLYRHPPKIGDRICPNLWLTTGTLEFKDHDLFVAHEIAQLKPLWDKKNCYKRFVESNSWLRRYLPNWEPGGVQKLIPPQGKETLPRSRPSPLDWLDTLAFKLQLGYMRRKVTREKVEKERALFHPLKTKEIILEKYESRVKPL